MERMLRSGISFFSDLQWITSVLPILESGSVECLEQTFESTSPKMFLDGTLDLLREFSQAGCLLGHSLDYPLLSAANVSPAEKTFARIFQNFSKENLKYAQVSAHFGFIQSDRFQKGAPLPMPLVPEVEEQLCHQLQTLTQMTEGPVGVENLALTMSRQEALEMGPFLGRCLKKTPGSFLLLDLHNLYCATKNYELPFLDLLKTYPLQLVTEIHLSGGSESKHTSGPFRRDTHDDRVPAELLKFLESSLPLLPQLKFVVLEQLPETLKKKENQKAFQDDFLGMKSIVDSYKRKTL
jgi:uncharacterized protein